MTDKAAFPGTTFRPLKPPKNLTSELLAHLMSEITGGALKPGQRLPTEQEMVASFGVSRTVIREAVAALRAEGLVVTRQGLGAFVSDNAERRPFRIDPDGLSSIKDVLNIMELRMSVEIEAAGLAAKRRTQAQLTKISDTLEAVDRSLDQGDTAVDADFAFHCAISESTGNPYYLKFLEFLGRIIIPRQSVNLQSESHQARSDYLRGIQGEHRKIYEAIDAQDAARARTAARRHLVDSRNRYERLAAAAAQSTAKT